MRTWLKWMGGAMTLAVASSAMAADHRDAPEATADPTTDINDVYTWIDNDRVILVMTVFPVADATSKFSSSVQYVFNVDTGTAFGETTESNKLVCTFDAEQYVSCWFGAPGQESKEYVTGDASGTGVTSDGGRLQVFTGLRADPFYFNLDGFRDAVDAVKAAAGGLTFDPANCPNVDAPTSAALVGLLQSTMDGTAPAVDFFGPLNTLSIIVSLDRSVLNADHTLLTVWASTHMAP